jgi:hypothetical protein
METGRSASQPPIDTRNGPFSPGVTVILDVLVMVETFVEFVNGVNVFVGETFVIFAVVFLIWPTHPAIRIHATTMTRGTRRIFFIGVFTAMFSVRYCPVRELYAVLISFFVFLFFVESAQYTNLQYTATDNDAR